MFNDIEYQIENTFTLAYNISPFIPLRTLDIIQIASALKIKSLGNIDVQYFITNDLTILNNASKIFNLIKILPISCSEFISPLKAQPNDL